jgi:cytochrome P450
MGTACRPTGALINFTVADIGLDEEVWGAPLEFRPGRFLTAVFHKSSQRLDTVWARKKLFFEKNWVLIL